MKFEVYCITNNITGKKYIGITNQGVLVRFSKHCAEANGGSNRCLCKSIRKYGKDAFTVKCIDEANSFDEVLKKEIHYINIYGTLAPNGYNMTAGGEGSLGRILKPETILKMSKAKMGVEPWNKGLKGVQKGVWAGKKLPEEARRKMSEAKKGKKLSEETKAKRKYIYENMKGEKHPLYGVGHSEESRKKMSASKKGQGAMSYKAYNDQEERIFNSLSEVKEFLGIKGHSCLMKAIKNNTIYKTYYWEKLK